MTLRDIEIISSLFVGLDSRIGHMRLLHAATKECESRLKLLHHGNFFSTMIPKAIVSDNKYLSIAEVRNLFHTIRFRIASLSSPFKE